MCESQRVFKQFHSKKKKTWNLKGFFFRNFAPAACVRYNSRAFSCRSSFLIWPYFVKKFHKLKSQGFLEYCAKVSCCIAATVLLSEIFCWFSSVFYYGSMILLYACVRVWIFIFFYLLNILWRSCHGFCRFVYLLTINFTSNQMFPRIQIIFNGIFPYFLCVLPTTNDIYHFLAFQWEKKGKFCILTSATTFTCRYKRETFLSSITMSRIF